MRTALLLALGCGMIVSLEGLARGADEEWKKIENQYFSFSAPAALKKAEVRGIDSFVEKYESPDLKLSFDYGWYSNNFSDWAKETKYEEVKIDGKPAKIGTLATDGGFNTQVHIKVDGKVSLSMHARCKGEAEVKVARKIFESLKFAPPKKP